MALFGPPDVEKLKAKRDVKRLMKLLDHEDAALRGEAAGALGEIVGADDPDSGWVLEGLLVAVTDDEDEQVRALATEALLRVSDPTTGEPAVMLLRDRNALASALPALITLCSEPGDVAEAARMALFTQRDLRSLTQSGDPRAFMLLLAEVEGRGAFTRPAIDALAVLGDASAVEPLIAVFEEGGQLALPALDALEILGDTRAVDPLIRVLLERGVLAQRAIYALARIGDGRAVEPLLGALEEGGELTLPALDALETLGDARAVEPLIVLLASSDRKIEARAARALGTLNDPRAVGPLLDALRDGTHPERQEAAALALGDLGDQRALEPLLEAARNDSPGNERLQKAALRALRLIGGPAAEREIAEHEERRAQKRQRRAQEREATPRTEQTVTSNEPITVAGQRAPRHGGLGEPYCSERCYELGGQTIAREILSGWVGDCSVCRGPVRLQVGGPASMVCYRPGEFLYFCGSPSCRMAVKNAVRGSSCVVCGAPS